MLIEHELIERAKEKLGDDTPDMIAELLHIDGYDPKKQRGLCPFHSEDTPSFIYNPKSYSYHCFGCNVNADIIDAFMNSGLTYIEAVQKLFDLTNVKYSFGEHGVKTNSDYKYPHDEPEGDMEQVYDYLGKRGISKETIDYAGLRQDSNGNIVFRFFDTNDTLTMVKYRPARKVQRGENKTWCQKGADTCPLLFNMNRVSPDQPLVITEGECFPGNAEVLTENGWCSLETLPTNSKIMQVDEKLNGSFVHPLAYINKPYSGEMLEASIGGNFYTKVTPNHNMVYIKRNGELIKRKACEVKPVGHIPTAISYSGNGIPLTNDQISLYIAVSADCTIDIKATKRYSRFAVKKERKYLRMKSLLERLGIQFHDSGLAEKSGYYYLGFTTPDYISSKVFPYEWVCLATYEQKMFILDEMVYWDGNRVKNRKQTEYSSVINKNAEFIQTIAHTSGIMSTVMKRSNKYGKWNKVSILHGKTYVSTQRLDFHSVHHEGRVYCVTVPTGMILVRQNGHIYVCGNCDCLSAIECGWQNAVSVPLGANNTHWIEQNWEWLQQFKSIVLCGDNDEPGQKMIKDVSYRLGSWRTKIVSLPTTFTKKDGTVVSVKDLNEVLYWYGKDKALDCIVHAKESPVESVVDFSDIKEVDLDEVDGLYTGIKDFDIEMMRLFYGTFNIVTGVNGAGKSSFLSQLVCQCMEQGRDAWLYSKELPNYMSKNWINYILAGARNVESFTTIKGAVYYKVKQEAKDAIDEFYKGRLYIYKDGFANTVEAIEQSMEDSARKFGCKLFIIDNLTAINLGAGGDDKWEKQVDLVNYLIDFAKKYNVVVILVIHPKKIETMRRLQKFDVAGFGSIVDLAHRLISLYRVTPQDKKGEPKKNGVGFYKEPIKYDVILDVLKDRLRGRENLSIGLYYDKPSRRFYTNAEEYEFQYAWDKAKYKDHLPYPHEDDEQNEVFGQINH